MTRERELKWAEDDARRVHSLFLELGGVSPNRARLLVGATRQQLFQAIDELSADLREVSASSRRSEIIFYYSGHGDSDGLHLGSDRVTLAELQAAIDRASASTTVVIIDACRSFDVRDKGATRGPAFEINLSRDTSPSGHVTIFSAGANEVAQESDEMQGSFFSHHLLSGLRGAADTDLDNRVTLAEFYQYAYNNTLTMSHGQTAAVQHPEMKILLEGEGELVLTVIETYSARLILPSQLEGDFLIIDDRNSRVVAQLQKSHAKRVVLALPRGRFRIQQRHNGQILAGVVDLKWGGSITLETEALSYQQPIAVARKGYRLDPEPWSAYGAFLFGHAVALESDLLLGGLMRLSRIFDAWTLHGTIEVGEASAQNPVLDIRHLEGRLGLGFAHLFHLGPVTPWLGASSGLLLVWQWQKRLLPTVTRVEPQTSYHYTGVTAGGYLAPELGIRISIGNSLGAALRGALQVDVIPVEGELTIGFGMLGDVGISYEF